MRLIDADALAARYMSAPPDYYHTSHIVGEITSAPTVKTQGWISVKDRLPEENGQYLVCLDQTHLMVVSFAKRLEDVEREVFAGRDEPGWFEWDTEWCNFYEVTMVTHWMPIPKLPQEVTEDASER